MTEQHPITPPPELVQQWMEDFCCDSEVRITNADWYLVAKAAQWGADQELEACCEFITKNEWFADPSYRLSQLLEGRRPKPPSLKQQALALLDIDHGLNVEDLDLIRRALEALPDD